MRLEDYLNLVDHRRKILIVSNLEKAQPLIRAHEKRTGNMVKNLNCMTLEQMSEMLYCYYASFDGYVSECQFIDADETVMVFRDVILSKSKKLSYFDDINMLNQATTNEILDKVNLIRANGIDTKKLHNKNNRLNDLQLLVTEYEKRLTDEKLIDSIKRTKYVVEQLKGSADNTQVVNAVFSAEISYLVEDMRQRSGLELEFVELLINAQDPKVIAFEKEVTVDNLNNCKDKSHFFKGYGLFNEANYVANDILAKEIAFGNVTVLYSSSTQLPAITSALRGNGIRANFVSQHSAKDNPYISLAKRIIAWALDDYSEKSFEEILSSSVIKVEGEIEIDGKVTKANLLSGQKYFDYILNARNRFSNKYALGWGYKRNYEFAQYEKNIAEETAQEKLKDKENKKEKVLREENNKKNIIAMHNDLLEIFGKNGDRYEMVHPIDLYYRVVEFIDNYKVYNDSYPVGITALRKISKPIGYEYRELEQDDALQLIDELLNTVSVNDSSDVNAVINMPENTKTNELDKENELDDEEDDGKIDKTFVSSVIVKQLSDWTVLERPYVYVIGLSLTDLRGNTTESPIISDDEMENLFVQGYIPTVENEARIREQNLLYTLKTFDGDMISFGYSDYDTINFYQSNPSSFFLEALSAFGDCAIEDIPEFVYGNSTDSAGTDKLPKWKEREEFDIFPSSATPLEVMLDCPKKYAFERVVCIPDSQFKEADYNAWLDPMTRGTFFHEIAEKYCNEKIVRKASEAYENEVDEDYMRQLGLEIEEKLLNELPCAYRALADRETDLIVEAAIEFFQGVLDEINESGEWRVLVAEEKFVDAKYKLHDYVLNDYDGQECELTMRGYIDLIEYRLDKSNNLCYIRVLDYKTGKKDSKVKENEIGKLIQYTIYSMAVTKIGKVEVESDKMIPLSQHILDMVADLEEDASIQKYKLELDSFQYVFPMDPKDKMPFVIKGDKIEGLNIIRLKAVLTMINAKHIYPDHKQFRELLDELKLKESSDADEIRQLVDIIDTKHSKEIGSCEYCDYVNLCANRKAGEIK